MYNNFSNQLTHPDVHMLSLKTENFFLIFKT